MTTKVIQGHMRPLLCQNHFSRFVYGPILMKICIKANIMKTYFFHQIIYDLKCHFYFIAKFCDFFTLRPYDLITTLSYVLMENFCFIYILSNYSIFLSILLLVVNIIITPTVNKDIFHKIYCKHSYP